MAVVCVALVIVVVGASTLAFLSLRAQQHPWLNSGNPSNWQRLIDVVRRAQYPPRTPFDDPTVMHGAANPGRTVRLLAYQVANYAQYFDWQWASSLGELARASIARLAITIVMATLGIRGAFAQRRADPTSFAFVATLFVTTGPLLLLYLNFKPGPSIGWDHWFNLVDHEVRDRDYFFVASFVAWAIWVAIALVDIARQWIPKHVGWRRRVVTAVFAVALVPVVLNFHAATRRQTAEATLARDFAHALLGSVPQDAILFTFGDNDTFPVWYAQQVEGFRPDVTVICLSLAQTAWYIYQFSTLYDLPRDQVARPPFRTPRELQFAVGGRAVATIAAGAAVYPADILVIEILRQERRSPTSGVVDHGGRRSVRARPESGAAGDGACDAGDACRPDAARRRSGGSAGRFTARPRCNRLIDCERLAVRQARDGRTGRASMRISAPSPERSLRRSPRRR